MDAFESFEPREIMWWESILLWFLPAYVVCDDGYAFWYKRMFGVTYLVKTEELPSRKK